MSAHPFNHRVSIALDIVILQIERERSPFRRRVLKLRKRWLERHVPATGAR